MDRGLVTLGGTASSVHLLREAAEQAVGSNAELVLFSTFTRREYEHDLEVLDRIATGEHRLIGEASGPDFARDVGKQLAKNLLSEFDIEYEVVGAIVDDHLGRRIVSEATERDCDHVFLLSKRRSRFSGVVGKTARTVLKETDGITSIAYEQEPERRVARIQGESVDDYDIAWMDY